MSSEQQPPPSPPPWPPSHVRVAVLQARGLRAKRGPGDAFVALQLGRQKLRTAVATQQGGCPRWDEPCALELPPEPPPLELEVWQRALLGPDRFLGRAAVPLAALLQEGRSHPDRWYRLHSKPGKKEKERGEIQLTIQFTRHSLTASMFDLSIKDKPRSPFGRLKDKLKGKPTYDMESASAIVSSSSSSSGALDGASDLGGRRDLLKGFFSKSQLRRASWTRSNTSLGSESTVSAASSPVRAAPSPSRPSSLSADPAGRDFLPSHKRAFSDEVSQINILPEPQSVQSLKAPKDPGSRSSLCINGSHIYCEEPSPKPSFLSLTPLPPSPSDPRRQERGLVAGPSAAEPDLPPWPAGGLQRAPPRDPPRFIPSPPILAAQEEDKLSVKTIALNKQRVRARMEEALQAESKPTPTAAPPVFPPGAGRVRPQEEKEQAEAGPFQGGRSHKAESPEPVSCPEATAGGEEGRGSSGWIGLRDSREAVRRPSSQPGLPATPELAKDPCVSEDQGLPSSVQVGEAQAGTLAPTASLLEPPPAAAAAAAARPPVEGDDGFDAFAASRLQPGAPGEPPEPSPAAGPPGGGGLPGGTASLLQQPGGESAGPARVPWECPDWPCFVFGDRDRASWGSGAALLEGGPFGGAGSSIPTLGEEQAQGQPGSCERAAAAVSAAPEEALSWTLESCAADPFTEEQDGLVPWSRGQALPRSHPTTPEAESGEASCLRREPERQEPLLGLGAERAPPTPRSPAEEERREPVQTEGPPPPKPPRRVSPLSLQEEAAGAGRGPATETYQHLPPVAAAAPPPGAAPSLGPAAIIGEGAHGAAEGLRLAAVDGEALADDKLGSREAVSGDALLAANEGAGGAEQFATCPSRLSSGGSGLLGSPEGGPGEPGSAPWGLGQTWPPGLPCSASLRCAESLPRPPEASQGPAELWPEPSPSGLFWSASEEQRGLPGGSPSWDKPQEQLRGPGGVAPGPAPSLPLRLGHEGSPAPEPEHPLEAGSHQAMEFKKASFWQEGSMERNPPELVPGNPFAPWAAPSAQNNPFVGMPADLPSTQPAVLPVSPIFDAQGLRDVPAGAGPPGHPSSHHFSAEPLAFSTPSFQAAPYPPDYDLPSPLGHPATGGGAAEGPPFPLLSPPSMDASAPSVLPAEMAPAEEAPFRQTDSPHPVKPMRSSPGPESPRTEAHRAAGLSPRQTIEPLTPDPGSGGSSAASALQLEKTEAKQTPLARYHHLTREELLQLLLRREAELSKKEEQVRELENYIDRLLVRIMEQSPTLLQVPLGGEAKTSQ